jgi:hypothetical protein
MTPQSSSLSSHKAKKIKEYFSEQYLLINTVFGGVILLIIGYSALFSPESNAYPVVCLYEKLTGLPCASCGLSHSFSFIVRGRLEEAFMWNIYGMRIFLFFFSQLIMRIVFSIDYIKYPSIRKNLIVFDIAGSVILLLISFYPFIRELFMGI